VDSHPYREHSMGQPGTLCTYMILCAPPTYIINHHYNGFWSSWVPFL